jgi:hypothetical protein
VPNWLSRFLTGKSPGKDARPIQSSDPDDERPAEDLRPVLIPSPILAMINWPGPRRHFPDLPVSLTWAFLMPDAMLYLSASRASALDAAGVDWRGMSRSALVRDFERRPWSREFRNEQGDLEAVALMHEDGLGPSRLICCNRLLRTFSDGFSFFVPERGTALVLSARAGRDVRERIHGLAHDILSHAEVPMSEAPFDHALLRAALERVSECE